MAIRDEIIELVERENHLSVPITETTDLYQDMHLDSLSFVNLLMNLEEHFDIAIELPEMESCLIVGRLMKLIETKLRGKTP